MVQIVLDIRKSIDENAKRYFERAKKAKKKITGATEALQKSKAKLKKLEEKHELESTKEEVVQVKRQKKWFEKFRWFYTTEGFLVIGGRDATTNEIVIKKHTDKEDLVFHTDMAGSPFLVIKTEGKEVGEKSLQETADMTACYSRAWKAGLGTTNVFYCTPEQVSKKAQAGEYLAKGAFMIYGKVTYIKPRMELAIGIQDGVVIGGPVEAVKTTAEKSVLIMQGDTKVSDVAKTLKKHFGQGDLDDFIRMLPVGTCKVRK